MNHTVITEFVLLGLSDDPELQVVIFLFLFITYILSVPGNLTIIALTWVFSHLQAPMYFFLRIFSFLEISFTAVCIHRFLGAIIIKDRTNSYKNHATQLFFFMFRGDWTLRSNRRVLWPLCCHLQAPALRNHQEQETLQPLAVCARLRGFLTIFPPRVLLPQLD